MVVGRCGPDHWRGPPRFQIPRQKRFLSCICRPSSDLEMRQSRWLQTIICDQANGPYGCRLERLLSPPFDGSTTPAVPTSLRGASSMNRTLSAVQRPWRPVSNDHNRGQATSLDGRRSMQKWLKLGRETSILHISRQQFLCVATVISSPYTLIHHGSWTFGGRSRGPPSGHPLDWRPMQQCLSSVSTSVRRSI
jgi:hypothetical protein